MFRTFERLPLVGIALGLLGFGLGGTASYGHPDIELQILHTTREIALEPRTGRLYLKRGELHRIHQDWELAESDFRRAAEVGPDLPEAEFHLARVLLDTGRAQEALSGVGRFLERRPGHVAGLVLRARTRAVLGRAEEAVADWNLAIAGAFEGGGAPTPAYYLERAALLESLGRTTTAIAGLEDGLERLGRPITLELRALELETAAGRWEPALARIDRMAGASPRKETWLARRGEILERAGRLPEARRAYHEAQSALERLPAGRRSSRAMLRLRESLAEGLARIDAATAHREAAS